MKYGNMEIVMGGEGREVEMGSQVIVWVKVTSLYEKNFMLLFFN